MTGSFKKMLDGFAEGEATPGEMLKTFRKRDGLTLKAVEKLTGIKESNLSAIENGRIEMTKRYAETFAKALKVHPSIFLYPNGKFATDSKNDATSEAAALVVPTNLPRTEVVKRLWAYIKKHQLNEFKQPGSKMSSGDRSIRKLAKETHHLKRGTKKAAARRKNKS